MLSSSRGHVNFILTNLGAVACRDGDAKDINPAWAAVELVALRQLVALLCRRAAWQAGLRSENLLKINELEERWSG